MASGDVFGVNDLQDRLKALCREKEWDVPESWLIRTDDCSMKYAVSLHLTSKDNREDFDAQVVFLLNDFSEWENREAEERLLRYMFEKWGEPVVLTEKVTKISGKQLRFYESLGMLRMPVRWEDNKRNEYEVYIKGEMFMDAFASVMDWVEYLGKEIVYNR